MPEETPEVEVESLDIDSSLETLETLKAGLQCIAAVVAITVGSIKIYESVKKARAAKKAAESNTEDPS